MVVSPSCSDRDRCFHPLIKRHARHLNLLGAERFVDDLLVLMDDGANTHPAGEFRVLGDDRPLLDHFDDLAVIMGSLCHLMPSPSLFLNMNVLRRSMFLCIAAEIRSPVKQLFINNSSFSLLNLGPVRLHSRSSFYLCTLQCITHRQGRTCGREAKSAAGSQLAGNGEFARLKVDQQLPPTLRTFPRPT